jgi:endonuclease/exonuclease/phosphatase family metal-dependent hydrolase
VNTSSDVIRIASANFEEGGLDPDGSGSRWEHTMTALAAWSPDVVCVQEMAARRDALRLRAHLWATANALGMVPVLGPPDGISGNHPAILSHPGTLTILDDGPPCVPGHDPAWCEALLSLAPAGPAIRVYSVHLPPRSAAQQLICAQQLAGHIAQRGELAIAAGDWNSWSPADQLTPATLASMPAHLRPARMHTRPGQPPAANYQVHHTLEGIGLIDAAAALDPARRDPHDLTPTGINHGGRVDRIYLTSELWESGTVRSYAQKDGGGSDHHMIMITMARDELDRAAPPGFQP